MGANKERLVKFKVIYLGGHTSYQKELEGVLFIKDGFVNFEATKEKIKIRVPIEKIKRVWIRKVPRSWEFWGPISPIGITIWRRHLKYAQIIYKESDESIQELDVFFRDDDKDMRKTLFLNYLPEELVVSTT